MLSSTWISLRSNMPLLVSFFNVVFAFEHLDYKKIHSYRNKKTNLCLLLASLLYKEFLSLSFDVGM